MQKKLLIITVCMIAFLAIGGIVVTSQRSKKSQQIEQIIQGENEQGDVRVSLETAREEADTLVEEARSGAYRNLEFNELTPLITEADRIYKIKVSPLEAEVTEETLQNVLDAMQAFFEEPISEKQITVNSFDGISVNELRQELQEQNEEYTQGYYLIYRNGEQYAQINSWMNSFWIDLGLEGVVPSLEDLLDKEYYPGAEDGSLQDVYETGSGELSVEEAIEQVENYFNHNFPVDLTEGIEYRVAHVYILNMPDGTYSFDFAMRRAYGGVLFESAKSGNFAYGEDESADLAEAVLDKENHVLFFNGVECIQEIEEMQEISEVVSLKKATEYISQKIGDNTVYTVKGIELSYAEKIVDEEDGSWYSIMTPVWTFITVNNTDDKEVRFYVDVVTGEVSTRIM